MNIDNFLENYKRIISDYRKNKESYKEHYIYEVLWAIKKKYILWSDLPPNFQEKYKIPHIKDYGIDLISLENDFAAQVKHYGNKSTINFSHMANFYAYSSGILGISKQNLYLLTTQEAKIDKMAERLLLGCNIDRMVFQDMIDEVPTFELPKDETLDVYEIEQRQYLVDCSKIFRESEKKILKFELPCGMGKSFIVFDIIKKSSGKHIIFVPWLDLAKQFYKDANNLGINCGIICENKEEFNENTEVIICTYASNAKIPDMNFKFKFIDEAHHLESEGSLWMESIDKIKCEKELHLSATFKNSFEKDFSYNLRDAIDGGYLSDYLMHLEFFSGKNKMNSLLKLCLDKREWFPAFIYFNSTEKAIQFSKILNDKGVYSEFLTGNCGKIKRDKIIKLVKNYNLPFLCLCGVFNEGISINELHTVIFGDLRFSDVNKIQVSMRASRKCKGKPFYRIVLPLIEDEFAGKDVENFIKTFLTIDPKIKNAIKNQDGCRIKIRKDCLELKNEEQDADFVREEIYNSMGKMIAGMTQEEKCDSLLEWVEKEGRIPLQEDNKQLYFFWRNCKTEQKLEKDDYTKLLNNNILRKNYEEFIKKHNKNKGLPKLSVKDKIDLLEKYVLENKRVPMSDDKIMFEDNTNVGKYWYSLKNRKYLENEPFSRLLKINILKNDFDKYKIQQKIKITHDEKVEQLYDFVLRNNKIPTLKVNLFTDNSLMYDFWNGIKVSGKINRDPYKKLLECKILKENYENHFALVKKRNEWTPERKMNIMIEFIKTYNNLPDLQQKYDDGSSMIKFWYSIKKKNKKILDKSPYHNIFNIPILNKDYEDYHKLLENKKDNIKLTFIEKADLFKKWVEKNKKIPSRKDDAKFPDNSLYYSFWINIKTLDVTKSALIKDLLNVPIIKEAYYKYHEKVELEKGKEKISLENKVILLNKWANVHKKIPSAHSKNEDEKKNGIFWNEIKVNKKIDKETYCLLKENVTLIEDFNKYLEKISQKKERVSAKDKVKELKEWVIRENKIPSFYEKDKKFSDGNPYVNFWQTAKIRKKLDYEPYSDLLNIPILKKDYESYLYYSQSKKKTVNSPRKN